jgi:hypothetical protein
MRYTTALLPSLVIALSSVVAAQGQEFARVLRDGETATLSVFGPRPVDLAAKKLANEFGVAINVEDPIYLYRDDVQDVTPSGVATSGRRVLIPRAALLEMRVDLRQDGSLRDVRKAVADLVETANALLPFAYRSDRDGETFTLVATRTRDEQGRSIDCCSALAESQPGPLIAFRADDEPARSAFLRLIRSRPVRNHLVRSERGAYQLVPNKPDGYHWLMRCSPGESWCVINLAPILD